MATNTQKAVNRIKDRMRKGARMIRQHHEKFGVKYFVVGFGEVAPTIAQLVIKERDVVGGSDGAWPGCDQTWGIE
jgi:uncharacterized Zn finger protein (UPF0148 family)